MEVGLECAPFRLSALQSPSDIAGKKRKKKKRKKGGGVVEEKVNISPPPAKGKSHVGFFFHKGKEKEAGKEKKRGKQNGSLPAADAQW